VLRRESPEAVHWWRSDLERIRHHQPAP